jgi:hypothetical protein
MQFAQQRDALRNQKFHFRKFLSTSMKSVFYPAGGHGPSED